MRYEKPEMEVLFLKEMDVIRTSLTGNTTGSGNDNDPDAPDEW
jgi:hypothetical protein